MSEDFDAVDPISIEVFGYVTWSLGIFAGLLSFIAQYIGLGVGTSYDGFSLLWWNGASFLLISGSTIAWTLCIAVYLRRLSQERNKIASNLVALISLLTAIFWSAIYVLRMQIPIVPYDQSAALFIQIQMLLGLSGITLGLSLLGTGLIYMTRRGGTRVISVLTGIVFLLPGGYGILVGWGSGLSAFPMFTIYDIPWIAVVAIASSIMGIVINLNKPSQPTARDI